MKLRDYMLGLVCALLAFLFSTAWATIILGVPIPSPRQGDFIVWAFGFSTSGAGAITFWFLTFFSFKDKKVTR